MKSQESAILNLTALWALSESGLGGLLHGFKIPITGLVLGGFAVMIVSMMARLSQSPFKTIIQATLTVIMIKALVSPHSPPPAYLAVAFQGIIGALIYTLIPAFTTATFIYASLAMLESAAQKFIIMTILFGREIWTAMDAMFRDICQNWGIRAEVSASGWIMGIYGSIFIIWGWIIAIGLNRYIRNTEKYITLWQTIQAEQQTNHSEMPEKIHSKKFSGWGLFFIVLSAVSAFIWLSPEGKNIQTALYIFIRSVSIYMVFIFIVNPLIKKTIQRKAHMATSEGKLMAVTESLNIQKDHSALILTYCRVHYKGIRRWTMMARLLITAAIYEQGN